MNFQTTEGNFVLWNHGEHAERTVNVAWAVQVAIRADLSKLGHEAEQTHDAGFHLLIQQSWNPVSNLLNKDLYSYSFLYSNVIFGHFHFFWLNHEAGD